MSQVTCISLFKYKSIRSKIWAFGMMQFAHRHLARAQGLSFYKLMGSGKGIGFNPLPDWSTYALLTVWDSADEAKAFVSNSKLFDKYQKNSHQMTSLFLQCLKTQGQWSSIEPFELSREEYSSNSPILVITRASIKPRFLYRFWKYVPKTSKSIEHQNGLYYKKGIGETPITQMATISLWQSEVDLNEYAYRSKAHQKAIKMTRELGWYSEELFARFRISKVIGEIDELKDLELWPGDNRHKTQG